MARARAAAPAEMQLGPVAEALTDLLPLLVLGMAMLYTGRLFTFVDDEVWTLGAAAQPLGALLALFRSRQEPPLYGLLLHLWLLASRGAFTWLRVPSTVCFLAGLWTLSRAARRVGGSASAQALVWLGMLWPYGFHYGRVAGSYSFTFFLISVLTWAYVRFCEAPSRRGWIAVCLLALALVYTHYIGWVLLALLAIDDWIRNPGDRRRQTALRLLGAAAFLVVASTPLWSGFARALFSGTHGHLSAKVLSLQAGYNLYVLFVSEAMAPWIWRLGIPATIAVGASLVLACIGLRGTGRRLLLYAAALFVATALAGVFETARLLVVAPWFLVALAVALGTMKNAYFRRALAILLVVIASIGWYGMYSRRFYASVRFLEPWADLSSEAAKAVHDGGGVIGNNPSFFFYLTYALEVPASDGSPWRFRGPLPEVVQHPQIWNSDQWQAAGRPLRPYMVWVEGRPENKSMDDASVWLGSRCGERVNRYLVRDPGYVWKQRFFPELTEVPWRIETEQYTCGPRVTVTAPSAGNPGGPPAP